MGRMMKGSRVCFEGNENVLELTVVIAAQLWEYTKKKIIELSTLRVNSMLCELHLTKAVIYFLSALRLLFLFYWQGGDGEGYRSGLVLSDYR